MLTDLTLSLSSLSSSLSSFELLAFASVRPSFAETTAVFEILGVEVFKLKNPSFSFPKKTTSPRTATKSARHPRVAKKCFKKPPFFFFFFVLTFKFSESLT